MSNKNAFYDESTKTLTVTHADKESFGLFYGLEECKQLVLKEGIKELPGHCINNFNEIEELILPDTLETLPCFIIPCGYASKNKRVHFGKGLKSISYDNPNYYEFEHVPHRSDLSCLKDIETVTIDPDNQCFKIENDLFLSKDGTILYAYIGKGCNELIIPKTVKEIKGHAFASCYKINKLIVPGTVKRIAPAFVFSRIGELIFEEGVEEISDNAFLRSHIENIKFPKSIKKFGKHPFIDACKLKILRLYEDIEYTCCVSLYRVLDKSCNSAFWFNTDGHFNELEFIEIYDKNDNLLRRYGLISDKEKNIKSEDPLSDYWIEWYHEHLFRSIAGFQPKKDSHTLPVGEQFCESPLNFGYIADWKYFKDPITKNRFICGILPELENIDEKSKRIFINYAWENIADIYKMAQKNNFNNVIEILKNFPFDTSAKTYAFDNYCDQDIKEKLDAICLYNSKFISTYSYEDFADKSGEEITKVYNSLFKDVIEQDNKRQKDTKSISERDDVVVKCEQLLKILYDKYGGDKERLNHVNNMSLPISKEEKKFLVDTAPKVYKMSLTDLLLERDILYKEYVLPKGLTADVYITTKLNGSLAKLKYNVDTIEIRHYLNLIKNNWRATDSFGAPTYIPVMATPESVAVRDEALKNNTGNYPQIVKISKEEGINKIIAFLERCAEYASISKIGECLAKLPRKADGFIMLKRAAVIDWSEICIEGRFYELVIMAKSSTEVEMFIRSKKCDMANFIRVTNGGEKE